MLRSLREFKLSTRSALVLILVFTVVVVADQVTKALVTSALEPGDVVPIVPGFFNLTLTFNRGVAFGMFAHFSDGPRYAVLILTALIALSAVVFFFVRDYAHDLLAQCALVMIMAGAAGNIIDRIRLGMVVDFLDAYYQQYHWPAFNVADSAICIGVFILIFRRPERALNVSAG